MNKKQKKALAEIIITAVVFTAVIILDKTGVLGDNKWLKLALYLVPYIISGHSVVMKAVVRLFHGKPFDECFLMTTATIAAFAIGEFPEATAVMLFYQIGELFQSYAVGKSRNAISDMMNIVPEYANLQDGESIEQVDPDEVEIGSTIIVEPGEKIPIDGVVIEGESFLDTAALTGESVPRRVKAGDEVISGCINGEAVLKIRTTKLYEDSTVAKILDLVENAGSKKAKLENFITHFARYYSPAVTIGALLLAVLPPLILRTEFAPWIHRACIFLIVSCPCALVISVPLGFFGGIGAASKIGILIKGGNYLEAVSETSCFVFDKTGTLTKGEFKVTQAVPRDGISREQLIEAAALAEGMSTHPIAQSIRNAYGKPIAAEKIGKAINIPGSGIVAQIGNDEIAVGNKKLMEEKGVDAPQTESAGTIVYVSQNGNLLGFIVIDDEIKPGAKEMIAELKALGIEKTVMLSGDRKASAEKIGSELGLDRVYYEMLPQDKVSKVEKIIAEEKKNERLAYVGDGINDAPVLMRADIGLAMGSLGSDAAIEAADIVLMDDDLKKLPVLIKIARKTMRIVKGNTIFALAVKFAVIILGAFGLANMWGAVFADVGVTVLAILNSMRALRQNRK